MHVKYINGWSNKSFDTLLEILKDAFPLCEKLPTSNYDAKKIVKDLSLHYEKIDACMNNCIIYYKEYANASQCPTCGLSRWKTKGMVVKGKPKRFLGRLYVIFQLHLDFKGYLCHLKLLHT